MSSIPEIDRKEKPFEGKKVYFSGPIVVANGEDLQFNWKLVQFMKEGGANVLSEHVGGRTFDEREDIFAKNAGRDNREIPEPWFSVRSFDIECVDKATHLVAVVNKPSFGVGIEIQRALDKPKIGLNHTPILCLIHEPLLDGLTFMIKGVSKEENSDFALKTYKDVEDAQRIIRDFLLKH